jgi:hypothetical protein
MTSNPDKQGQKSNLDVGDILRRVDSPAILDSRTPDEIVGYEENGLPGRKRFRNREVSKRRLPPLP